MKRSNSKSLELAIFDPNQDLIRESNIWHPFPGSLLRALGRLCRDGRQHRGLGPKLVARAGLSDGHSVHDSTWTSRARTVAGQLLHSCGARVLVRLWLVPSRLGNDKYTWDNCNMPRRSDLRWTCVSWQQMADEKVETQIGGNVQVLWKIGPFCGFRVKTLLQTTTFTKQMLSFNRRSWYP